MARRTETRKRTRNEKILITVGLIVVIGMVLGTLLQACSSGAL